MAGWRVGSPDHLRQTRRLTAGFDFLVAKDDVERSLRALAAPHMPVLIHKRSRMATEEYILSGKWLGELVAFVERVGRYLAEDLAADRRRVVGLLDDIIADEQQKLANVLGRDPMPATSRFDMRWAN